MKKQQKNKTAHGDLYWDQNELIDEKNDSWLFYPLADCPPHGSSSMDEPPNELATVMFIHQIGSTTIFRMV